jgi:nicotinamide-nucleotide amidase
MKISTLSIGDEVIFGEIVDSNVAHIASRLYESGLQLRRHLCVGDNEPDILDAIEMLASHNDFVIATGGLGPTVDDLTARSAARATGRRLVLNEDALAHLKERYRLMGREMLPSTEKQALLPTKITLVPNPIGTACGFIIPHKGCFLFFLPGVPVEMKRMLDETVIPFILSRTKQKTCIETRVMRVLGLSETHVENRIQELARPREGLTIAYCVSFPEVEVKLRAEGENEARVREILDSMTIWSPKGKKPSIPLWLHSSGKRGLPFPLRNRVPADSSPRGSPISPEAPRISLKGLLPTATKPRYAASRFRPNCWKRKGR